MSGFPPDIRFAHVDGAYEWFRRYMDGEPVKNQFGEMMKIVSYEEYPTDKGMRAKIGLRPVGVP